VRSSKSKLSRLKIVLATSNPGKLQEMGEVFRGLPLAFLSLTDVGIRDKIRETGKTFFQNARLKSLSYSLKSDFLTLAEDSGLEVNELGGAPGIYSARYSAPRPSDEKNIRKVLRLMREVPWGRRQARFVCCLVLSDRGSIIKEVRGQVQGRVSFEKKGEAGFGYDPIFYYHPYRRTFGELAPEEKNRVSHRGRALRKMKAFLNSYLDAKPHLK
jgi:XTP/dITP diphosphohydrolase